jgi:hypothetical protein
MVTTAARPSARAISPALMLTVRQWHTYIGAFIAPSVLFFAFTGSLQLFSLHEAHGAYTPPAVVEHLGRVHKDQVWNAPAKAGPAKPRHAADDHDHDHDAGPADHPEPAKPWPVMALKWLFLTVAVGLMTSTLLGLWLAFTFSRRKTVVLGLFVAGAVLPVLLVLA